MPIDFFSSDRESIDARHRLSLEAATDESGEPLFPDASTPGTPGYNLRQIYVALMQQHYRELNAILSAASPKTAEGGALNDWAAFFGLSRKGATRSTGRVLLSSPVTGAALERLYGTRAVPAGTELTGGAVTLRTREEALFGEDETSVVVTAENAFGDGTTRVGSGVRLSLLVPSALREVITAETVTEIQGGAPEETDAQLRYRLVAALTSPSTYDGFVARLLAHEGVSSVELVENAYGVATAEAFVTPSTSFPPPTLRAELEALWRGPGRVYVTLPTFESVVLKIRVAREVPLSGVVDHINNLPVGSPLILNAVEAVLQNAGAGDAQVIAIKRGLVSPEGRPVALTTLSQVTNVSPSSPRSKWLANPDWITLCTL